jgi:hypothetical protein
MERPPSSRPTSERGVIDVPLDADARPSVQGAVGGRLLVGIFAVALGAGLLLAAANLLGSDQGSAAQPEATATPVVSSADAPPLTPVPEPSGFPTPRAEVTPDPDPIVREWAATAQGHRGQVGESFQYACPPDGTVATIFGTEIYTDDSSVCTAAVHMGLITLATGGSVTVEIRRGRDAYEPSRRNGITSLRWGRWPGSFVLVE